MWFSRFWTNGVRVAQITPNVTPLSLSKSPARSAAAAGKSALAAFSSGGTNQPKVNFSCADIIASAGDSVQVPITARIFGSYPLRVLMLNLKVVPLDGSPALTTQVQFMPNPALGQPTYADSHGVNNFAGVWLESTIAGLSGSNVSLGTLFVTIPTNAASSAAYAVHFDHASASPNGLGSFPKQTLTGLITLSDRSASSASDGIPDSWRLRYFGTMNNLLSQPNADADGDGMSNWQEYIAGTYPTDPASCLRASTDPASAQQIGDRVIRWPSVNGKQYVIECSPTLFPAVWTPVSTNTGNGTDIEFHDLAGGGNHFYRVRVLP